MQYLKKNILQAFGSFLYRYHKRLFFNVSELYDVSPIIVILILSSGFFFFLGGPFKDLKPLPRRSLSVISEIREVYNG